MSVLTWMFAGAVSATHGISGLRFEGEVAALERLDCELHGGLR